MALLSTRDVKQAFPYTPLATLPTAVERLDKLTARLGVDLWVKRDDQTSAVYGSSHLRKIEFLLADAQRRGARRIVTFGGVGSNWVVAWAAHARRLGMNVHAVVVAQPLTRQVRKNLLLAQHYGVDLHYAPTLAGAVGLSAFPGAGVLFSRLFIRLLVRERCVPYVIRPGGAMPLGCLGSALSGLELAEQIRQGDCPRPDRLFVTSSTAGTLAGLLAGLALAGMALPVVGVRVAERLFTNSWKIRRLAARTLNLLRRQVPDALSNGACILPPFEIVDDYFFREYGAPIAPAEAAVDIARADAGLALEGTYTGRTFAAFLAWAERRENRGHTAMFWNTYSGVDHSSLLESADWRRLPQKLWKYFDGTLALEEERVHRGSSDAASTESREHWPRVEV